VQGINNGAPFATHGTVLKKKKKEEEKKSGVHVGTTHTLKSSGI
jgi:hypothetical protein